MHALQASYLTQRNATERAWDNTEDQFQQSVYSCGTVVPYHDESVAGEYALMLIQAPISYSANVS